MKIDLTGVWIPCYNIGFGIRLYVCFALAYHQPLGFVWGIGHGGRRRTFSVLGSYVPEWGRRNGIRTAINKQILRDFDAVISGGSTKDGRAFQKASGYSYQKELDLWFKGKKKTVPAVKWDASIETLHEQHQYDSE